MKTAASSVVFWMVFLAVHGQSFSLHHCFHCASQFGDMDSLLIHRLYKQQIFFHPVGVLDPNCHLSSGASHGIQGQMCTSSSCVTIAVSNIDLNFTVRGCSEQVLKHRFLQQKLSDSKQDGCSLVRSNLNSNPNRPESLQFIVCFCSENWCNNGSQPQTIWAVGTKTNNLNIKTSNTAVRIKSGDLMYTELGEQLASDEAESSGEMDQQISSSATLLPPVLTRVFGVSVVIFLLHCCVSLC